MALIATCLELAFEGHFMCRIATDPDPTNERRGMSGYTMALAGEDPLDQVIRLQCDEAFLARNLREPARSVLRSTDPSGTARIGVFVTGVKLDGQPYQEGEEVFRGARVWLLGHQSMPPAPSGARSKVARRASDYPLPGPIFESRNNIVGSDDTMSFVVNPFHLRITAPGREQEDELLLEAIDLLDPCNPDRQLWQIDDPKLYERRLSSRVESGSVEVLDAIGVYDYYEYFHARRRFLGWKIAEAEKALAEVPLDDLDRREALELEIQRARSRIYQFEFWGERVFDKLGTLVGWSFDINGPKRAAESKRLGGKVDTGQMWPVKFWFGGWDGDLLTGFMRGSIQVPFQGRKR